MVSRATSGLAAHAPTESAVEDGLPIRAVTAAERLTARLDRLPMTRSLWIMAGTAHVRGIFRRLRNRPHRRFGPRPIQGQDLHPDNGQLFRHDRLR